MMDTKQEQIVAGALRRFSHYGINKTTMNDIADDLSMSKPSLYYYFPDKSALIYAVALKVTGEYMDDVKNIFDKKMDYAEAMLALIDYRYTFLKKYFMLHIGEVESEPFKDEKLLKLVQELRGKESAMITGMLKKALDEGALCIEDAKATSDLFLDAMMGLRLFLYVQKAVIPDQDTFYKLYMKQKQLAEIFINGIKCHKNGATNSK